MSKVSEMKFEDIIEQINLIMRERDIVRIRKDIVHICKSITIDQKIDVDKEIKLVDDFNEIYKKGVRSRDELKKFLIDNEWFIDKEKFVLLTIKNYIDNIKVLEKYVQKLKEELRNSGGEKDITEVKNYMIQLQQQKENLAIAMKLGKGMETFYTGYYYDEEEGTFRIEVVDSRELIDNKRSHINKALRRFDEVDRSFKDGNSEEGLEYVIQSMLLSDFYDAFPNIQFGNDFRKMILENEILRKNIKTKEELDEYRLQDVYEEYSEMLDSIKLNGALTEIKEALRKYATYVDMEKLLLISAYRFEEAVEKEYADPKMYNNVKYILEGILSNIKTDEASIYCELQNKQNNDEIYLVEYSVEDLKKCISRFGENIYLKKSEIEEYKEKINKSEINLSDIKPEYIDIIFSESELEQVSSLSVNNLLQVYYRCEWDEGKIIKLYEENKIPLEYIEEIKGFVNLSNAVNFEALNSYYNQIQEDSENKEALDRYSRYLEIYKEVHIKGKNKEEIQEYSSILIENLAETLGEEEYEQTVKNYYIEGLISLDSIVEWSNSSLITELFEQGIITLEDIKSVGVKLGYDYLNNLYTSLAYEQGIEYDKRIEYLESGFVEEDEVINLYNQGLIMDDDLLKLAQKTIVNLEYAKQTIDNRQLEDRIKTARAKALGWSDQNLLFHIDGIEKKHRDGVMYTDISLPGIRKEKLIIDPNIRQKYIEMLGLYRIETECSEENPFLNYEFYATPDESGAIGANSVIIAERYYQNKYDEKTFATNNATYFFKYKDFLVLSNLQKQDMIKERENVVFRTNHTITTQGKRGTWAENVLHNVLKTMLGSDLANTSKKEKRAKIIEKMSKMYTPEECKSILNLCEEIDSGKHICNKDGIKYVKNTVGPDFYDDSENR